MSQSLVHDVEGTETFTVGKLQGGYSPILTAWHGLRPGLGVSASAGFVPSSLEPCYGSRVNAGVRPVFDGASSLDMRTGENTVSSCGHARKKKKKKTY